MSISEVFFFKHIINLGLKLRRYVAHLVFHRILMILLVVAIIFQCQSNLSSEFGSPLTFGFVKAILLAGCSSATESMRNIYIVSFRYDPRSDDASDQNSTVRAFLADVVRDSRLEVRVAYFGICVSDPGNVAWICSNFVDDLRKTFHESVDPLDLITNGSHFKDDVVFPYLM